MEVGEVLAALKRHLGAAGDDPPFEGLVAGSATMPVTGVATCAAPSLDVLRRAVADGCNLLLADGHPFFTYDAAWITKGATHAIAHAPVTMAKADYMRRAGLAVIRLPSAWAAAMSAVGSVSLATWLGLGPGVPVPSGGDFVIVGGALARWVSQILPQTRVVPFAQDVPVHTLAAGCGQ